MQFDGKVVVITGASGILGKKVCQAFLEYGGKVVACDIDKLFFNRAFSKEIKTGQIYFQHLDIAVPASVEFGIKAILKKYKKIDVWANLAYPRTQDWGNPIDKVTSQSWNKNVQMHLGGYFWTSKIVLKEMKKRRKGCLINFASIYGVVGPTFSIYQKTGMTMPVAYAAIKGGIINLSKYLANLYGPFGIRVNTICPGGVLNRQPTRFIRNYSKITPLRRLARDDEIAMSVVFLASEAASYITGAALMVDGGWTAQ